jgi:hypothetical protein
MQTCQPYAFCVIDYAFPYDITHDPSKITPFNALQITHFPKMKSVSLYIYWLKRYSLSKSLKKQKNYEKQSCECSVKTKFKLYFFIMTTHL